MNQITPDYWSGANAVIPEGLPYEITVNPLVIAGFLQTYCADRMGAYVDPDIKLCHWTDAILDNVAEMLQSLTSTRTCFCSIVNHLGGEWVLARILKAQQGYRFFFKNIWDPMRAGIAVTLYEDDCRYAGLERLGEDGERSQTIWFTDLIREDPVACLFYGKHVYVQNRYQLTGFRYDCPVRGLRFRMKPANGVFEKCHVWFLGNKQFTAGYMGVFRLADGYFAEPDSDDVHMPVIEDYEGFYGSLRPEWADWE